MTITTESLLLACAALAALLLVAVAVSLWRLAEHKGHGRRRDLEIQALEVERKAMQQRLQDREEIIGGLRRDHERELAQLKADSRAQDSHFERQRAALQQELARAGQELTGLKTERRERESRHEEQLQLLNEARENLRKEFENLANRIFEDKGKSFTATSRASLEDLLKPFREQISGFQQRVNEVHDKSVRGNEVLKGELAKLRELGLEMNSQASNLTSALKGDKKTTGNWGEAQLERTFELAGLVKDEHYRTQAFFRDDEGRRKLPDFLILLPDGKSLVVDSKVSLVDYDRAVAAETDEARTEALAAHVQAVRNHIDDLNVKDYTNLPDIGSPDFVLMFMPIEPAYIEAMKQNKDLFDYGYRKNVVMVSHTTLMPILRVVSNLWMIDKSNREAREISAGAGDIYNQVCRVAERLVKLGNSMGTAQGHFNDTVKSLVGRQGLIGKVDRFQEVSAKANKTMPALNPIPNELEADRLTSALGDDNTNELSITPESAEGETADPKIRALKTDSQP